MPSSLWVRSKEVQENGEGTRLAAARAEAELARPQRGWHGFSQPGDVQAERIHVGSPAGHLCLFDSHACTRESTIRSLVDPRREERLCGPGACSQHSQGGSPSRQKRDWYCPSETTVAMAKPPPEATGTMFTFLMGLPAAWREEQAVASAWGWHCSCSSTCSVCSSAGQQAGCCLAALT